MPPTVLVRVSHPIFHRAVDSTPAPLRPAGSGMSLSSPTGDMEGALAPEGKLGSLQVRSSAFVWESEFRVIAVACPNSATCYLLEQPATC